MLVITASENEAFRIGPDITVVIVARKSCGQVQFGIEAPPNVAIERVKTRPKPKRAPKSDTVAQKSTTLKDWIDRRATKGASQPPGPSGPSQAKP